LPPLPRLLHAAPAPSSRSRLCELCEIDCV
jgi:hypothetical protein